MSDSSPDDVTPEVKSTSASKPRKGTSTNTSRRRQPKETSESLRKKKLATQRKLGDQLDGRHNTFVEAAVKVVHQNKEIAETVKDIQEIEEIEETARSFADIAPSPVPPEEDDDDEEEEPPAPQLPPPPPPAHTTPTVVVPVPEPAPTPVPDPVPPAPAPAAVVTTTPAPAVVEVAPTGPTGVVTPPAPTTPTIVALAAPEPTTPAPPVVVWYKRNGPRTVVPYILAVIAAIITWVYMARWADHGPAWADYDLTEFFFEVFAAIGVGFFTLAFATWIERFLVKPKPEEVAAVAVG